MATLQKIVDPKIAEGLDDIREKLGQAIRESRILTTDLSSPTLNTFGLEAGIEELVDEFSEKHPMLFDFQCSQTSIPLPKNIELVFFQSARELLCNIIKHARAKAVHLYLSIESGCLLLAIVDDGIGFDTSILEFIGERKCGFGLFSIRQRLTNLGGTFKIESVKNKGTTALLEVPMKSLKT